MVHRGAFGNIRSIALLSIWLASLSTIKAQVFPLVGAPLSATWTVTTDTAGTVKATRIEAARSSDGSTYQAGYDSNGQLVSISILDVPHAKRYEMRPLTKQYIENDAPQFKGYTRTAAQQHAILERSNFPHAREAQGQKKGSTPLGTKVVDGMTIYGSHYVRYRDKVLTMDGETWQSDLGLVYSSHFMVPKIQQTHTVTLKEIKRGEPDASLFTVPAGYSLTQR
ncbi:hypothetical protein GCM10011507_32640 [Edaphobacter acidisoli]|uniref:Uncharacterized protein n=1 Tax=Edaphobacter acidisoli TaxID=2040573 RepID=A0A916S332_9BACT|nr:hypothetical protein [Edaphobacter acidisoli]GGA78851.1 hypothetical protein GCM10011507_32640 [Edaphobacter acidisoli]